MDNFLNKTKVYNDYTLTEKYSSETNCIGSLASNFNFAKISLQLSMSFNSPLGVLPSR